MIRPWKLVTPVSNRVQYTHQAKKKKKKKIDTHPPSDSESEHSKGPGKVESEQKAEEIANYGQHSQP